LCIRIENDGGTGQNLTVKFLNDSGAISDYFTINKTGFALAVDDEVINKKSVSIYPVPASMQLNIKLNTNETIENVMIYNIIGALVLESKETSIDVSQLSTGKYMVGIRTSKNQHYKSIIIQ